jgi:hypothetical protein
MRRANYCTIASNICSEQVIGDGIYVLGDGTENADYNSITGNNCYNNGDDGLELSGDTYCNYNNVDNNVLIGNSGDDYVDGGNQSQFWGGSTESYFEIRPILNQAKIAGAGKPTRVTIGVFDGYSLPIYAADEELFFSICIPQRWCGEHDIIIHLDVALSQAENNKKFNLELCHEHFTPNADVIPATCNSLTVETDTGAAAAQYQTYQIEYTIDYDRLPADPIIADDILTLRIRRLDASTDEITGEIIVLHAGVNFVRDKVGTPE